MLTPAEAEQLIAQHLSCLPIESLPVGYSAGSILRENVYAERDQPPSDRVTMDGIAVATSGLRGGRTRLRIQATQAAGDPPLTLQNPEHCIEIMTGAALPADCDAVIPVERIQIEGGYAQLDAGLAVEPLQNVHRRGSDQRQGALLLQAGMRLEAPDIAVAAGAGMARVRVSQQPAVMVISTGNELVEPGEPIEQWQIRRSNAYAIAAALRRRGFQRVADDHIVDDMAVLQERIRQHLDSYEVLILSGGVSMGKFDLVPGALAACGVTQVFHKIAQRPGKPMWFGSAPGGGAVFALPGRPVSALVCLVRYVIPALYAAMGANPGADRGDKIALSAPLAFNAPLAGFVPVRVETDDWGRPWAVVSPHNGSDDFAALAGTDGFVELPPGPNTYPKGFVTRLYRW
ncbi:MAG TPA: molybdopterin molybdotransferase MoeA [Steroidobacteraceae bacterium]|jgi:molybdopterin molybdotransferase|nr:molybdopterin molybdotransferase MoeA [Steroidobacteraceae bacterium]